MTLSSVGFKFILDIVAIPIALQIAAVRGYLDPKIWVGAQNVSFNGNGAFTGEVTAEQLLDAGAKWTLIGHSERRSFFGESVDITMKKLKRSLETDLKVIFCIGEQLQERENGTTNKVLEAQLTGLVDIVKKWDNLVLAYEPVWAIGTGKVASPQQAEDAHKFIRHYLTEQAGQNVADKIRIIYGGSVTSSNAKDIIAQPNIDGFLVGGASLKEDFLKICEAVASST